MKRTSIDNVFDIGDKVYIVIKNIDYKPCTNCANGSIEVEIVATKERTTMPCIKCYGTGQIECITYEAKEVILNNWEYDALGKTITYYVRENEALGTRRELCKEQLFGSLEECEEFINAPEDDKLVIEDKWAADACPF